MAITGATDAAQAVRAIGGEALEDRADITDPAQTDRLVAAVLHQWGRLDAIINNAAIYGQTVTKATDRVTGVHLTGP